MGPKHFGVTTVTFQGHVMSSVTWPIDSPWANSNWLSIGTEPLSLTVFEIFSLKNPCEHRDTRRKWFYILSYAMYCIGQTTMGQEMWLCDSVLCDLYTGQSMAFLCTLPWHRSFPTLCLYVYNMFSIFPGHVLPGDAWSTTILFSPAIIH